MSEPLQRYVVDQLTLSEDHADWDYPSLSEPVRVYLAADVARRDTEVIAWFRDFIEWNACCEGCGVYRCNQCGNTAIPSVDTHDPDCDIVTARALLARLEKL